MPDEKEVKQRGGEMKKYFLIFSVVLAGLLFFIQPTEAKIMNTKTGLGFEDLKVGTGVAAVSGKTVSVHYTGWLDANGKPGKKFDSSLDHGQPFSFPLGSGMVIKGWDEGVAGMKIGGKRRLLIPASLGYGARGAGADIPPNANLIFDVELLGVK